MEMKRKCGVTELIFEKTEALYANMEQTAVVVLQQATFYNIFIHIFILCTYVYLYSSLYVYLYFVNMYIFMHIYLHIYKAAILKKIFVSVSVFCD